MLYMFLRYSTDPHMMGTKQTASTGNMNCTQAASAGQNAPAPEADQNTSKPFNSGFASNHFPSCSLQSGPI